MAASFRCSAGAAAGALSLAIIAATSGAAHAAIRRCHDIVSSDIAADTEQPVAKKKALDDWRAKAAALGSGFDGWHLAAERALKCFAKDGRFECIAVGAPCIIQQNPKQRPAGSDRKGVPL